MTGRDATIAGLLLVAVLIVCLELVARRKQSPVPGLAELRSAATAHMPGRMLTMAAWIWIGWHFFAR